MKDTDFDAHRLQLVDTTPSWEKPSRCNRPPTKPAPRPPMFVRLLSLLGLNS